MIQLIFILALLNPAEQFRPHATAAATIYSVDTSLVLAVIRIESNFDTLAVGPQGSLGLMQIQPATGEWIAGRCKVSWTGAQSLHDPRVNIKLGTCYLRMLLDQFGDEDLALAAYNWGPNRVERVLETEYLPDQMRIYPRLVQSKRKLYE